MSGKTGEELKLICFQLWHPDEQEQHLPFHLSSFASVTGCSSCESILFKCSEPFGPAGGLRLGGRLKQQSPLVWGSGPSRGVGKANYQKPPSPRRKESLCFLAVLCAFTEAICYWSLKESANCEILEKKTQWFTNHAMKSAPPAIHMQTININATVLLTSCWRRYTETWQGLCSVVTY